MNNHENRRAETYPVSVPAHLQPPKFGEGQPEPNEIPNLPPHHFVMTPIPPDWSATKWWRVIAPNGSLWCETSFEDEARKAMRPGDRLERLYQKTEEKWVYEE